ncbi:MAG: hypothetical protein U0T31_02985 [Chitinophagales bacterium]|nr:hypothetical protein [Chitinophagales bacterium]
MKKTPFEFRLLTFSCFLFIVSTGIAMLFFPGGTILNHNTKGYSFFNNFFSELGRWRTVKGESNWISFFGFELALIFHSVVMFIFNRKLLIITNSKQLNPFVYYTALITGSLFPLFLTGIALTPCDLYLPFHMDFVYAAFGTLVPLSLAYTLLIRQHHLLPNKYGNTMMVIVFAITIYLFIMLYGPDPHKVGYVQQTAQKIIVYSMIFCLLYLSSGCRKYLTDDSLGIK